MVEGIVTDTLAPVVELTLIGEEERRKKIRVVIDIGLVVLSQNEEVFV